jgi:hypothetical protein
VGGNSIVLTPRIDNGELLWDCGGNLNEIFLSTACSVSTQPMALPSILESGSNQQASAPDVPATSGPPEVESRALPVDESTCNSAFRSSEAWQNLGAKGQKIHRQRCNDWKLQQLDMG